MQLSKKSQSGSGYSFQKNHNPDPYPVFKKITIWIRIQLSKNSQSGSSFQKNHNPDPEGKKPPKNHNPQSGSATLAVGMNRISGLSNIKLCWKVMFSYLGTKFGRYTSMKGNILHNPETFSARVRYLSTKIPC